MGDQDQIREQLRFLYGDQSGRIYQLVIQIIEEFQIQNPGLQAENFNLTEEDAILITYGDQIQAPDQNQLHSLSDFIKRYLDGAVNWIHLLPFYPYSSDDGFSVIDYRQVDPELGTWNDLQRLSRHYSLMFDAVINHISRRSEWFQQYRKGNSPYNDYFIEIDPSIDLSSIFRPRALPLLTQVDTHEGQKYVWTTFSEDQIDLDYSNPQVLIEIIKLLLFYVEKGASLIRLDAVGYMWKEIGTSCLNLPQAHSLVKILRSVINLAAPSTGLITETNVPHDENIKYFGDPAPGEKINGKPQSGDEAQLVYQFSLAPLVLHTFYSKDVTVLTNWVKTLQVPYQDSAFFNFIASHDGIGVTPAKDLLSDGQINELVQRTLQHGGEASYKTNPDGTESVYELNITLYDALNNPAESNPEIDVKRFIASQVIMLSLAGIPGIYIHSLFGSRNCYSCRKETGRARSINREKFELESLKSRLNEPENIHSTIFERYKRLLMIRKQQAAFHPAADQQVIQNHSEVFILLRANAEKNSVILCLVNASPSEQLLELSLDIAGLDKYSEFQDLLSEKYFPSQDGNLHLKLGAYQAMWLSARTSIGNN